MNEKKAKAKRKAEKEAAQKEIPAMVIEHLWQTWDGRPVMKPSRPEKAK